MANLHKNSAVQTEPLGIAAEALKEAGKLHRKAMEYAQQAFVARLNGKEKDAKSQFEEAYEFECRAANAVADYDLEPTRSVLHRSAATLALDCHRYTEAVVLAKRGLHGSPPDEIEQELHDVFEKVPKSILSSLPESVVAARTGAPARLGDVQDVLVAYNKTSHVTVPPPAMDATVRFKRSNDGKRRSGSGPRKRRS